MRYKSEKPGASGVEGLHVFGNTHDKARWSISNHAHYASTDRMLNVARSTFGHATVNIWFCL